MLFCYSYVDSEEKLADKVLSKRDVFLSFKSGGESDYGKMWGDVG